VTDLAHMWEVLAELSYIEDPHKRGDEDKTT
jgi:hypothetical protein